MIELTVRLTLSSCVSQLTNLYATEFMAQFIEEGFFPITVSIAHSNGELFPYRIELLPQLIEGSFYCLEGLTANVLVADGSNPDAPYNIRAVFNIDRKGMMQGDLYKCALHVAGDFIKFHTKG